MIGRRSREVRERILRLNPQPVEGGLIRGWHPAPTVRGAFNRDVGTRQMFEGRWGKGSWAKLPKSMLVSGGGKRRWVPWRTFVQGPPA